MIHAMKQRKASAMRPVIAITTCMISSAMIAGRQV